MKRSLSIGGFLVLVSIGSAQGAMAQVIPDGTVGSIVSPGPLFSISGGTRPSNGPNLFHSFSQFSLPIGSSAIFQNDPAVQTIFSRVTGGSRSDINGIIQTQGNASLFLMNPNGILFGPNAKLELGGSFIGTTANRIQFEDGIEFSAANLTATPLLSVKVPIGLQMGQNPAAIEIWGNTTSPQLNVMPETTLALIGGNITVNQRTLSTPQGRIVLGSVDFGSVTLAPNSQGWNLDHKNIVNFRDLSLSNQTLLSNGGNGETQLWGANISVTGGSRAGILNITNHKVPGRLAIHATELLAVRGENPSGSTVSSLGAAASGSGLVANVEIVTKNFIADHGGVIVTNNFGSSIGGGHITVRSAGTLEAIGVGQRTGNRSGIVGVSSSSGKGGNITISTHQLVLRDGAVVTTTTSNEGTAGAVTVNSTDSIEIIGVETQSKNFVPSSLSSSTLAGGNSGNLLINTARLAVYAGGRVEASSYASGDAGTVTIKASELVEVAGKPAQSFLIPSFVGSSTVQQSGTSRSLTGNSKDVTIETPQLKVYDSGLINVRNDGMGNAGSLEIIADSVSLNTQGSITATTQFGERGNIAIIANSLILRRESNINATSGSTGNGGNITIDAPIIIGLENSDIIANAVKGKGGNIQINTQSMFGLKYRDRLTPSNDITASSEFGINGSVQVNTIGINPTNVLNALPVDIADSTPQLNDRCGAAKTGAFISTGRGGIPQNPIQRVKTDRPWKDLRPTVETASTPIQPIAAVPSTTQIVEASAIEVGETGAIALVAAKPIPSQSSATCGIGAGQ